MDNMLRVKMTTMLKISERRVKKDMGASPPKKIPLVEKVIPSLEKQKTLPKTSKFQSIFQSR